MLRASKDAYVDGDGRIVTTGIKGGAVEVLGNTVTVTDNSVIDASGTNGGGTVLVGGDYQGRNSDVKTAKVTYFGENAMIKADATDHGDGGKIIVWADDTTEAHGTISARGGANGGNGGFVEVSGHHLDFHANVDTRAPNGKTGMLWLDPDELTINDATWLADYQSLGTDTTIQTTSGGTGNITFNGSGANNTFGFNLTILAHGGTTSTGDISFNNFKLDTVGSLNMVAGWDGGSVFAPDIVNGKGNITVSNSDIFSNGTMYVGGGYLAALNLNVSSVGFITVDNNAHLLGEDSLSVVSGGNVLIDGGSHLISGG